MSLKYTRNVPKILCAYSLQCDFFTGIFIVYSSCTKPCSRSDFYSDPTVAWKVCLCFCMSNFPHLWLVQTSVCVNCLFIHGEKISMLLSVNIATWHLFLLIPWLSDNICSIWCFVSFTIKPRRVLWWNCCKIISHV